jgi:hypothetical protein
MSDFARGVVGVFVVGLVAGAGALMFIPKSPPSASQVASLPASACAPHAPRKNEPACAKMAAQHREGGNKDAATERVLSSASSVATNGRTAAGLVTVDAQAIAALRRGESLQPEPVTEAAPEAPAAAPEPATTATTTTAAAPQPAAAPAVAGAATRRAAYTTARRAPPVRRTARQNAAYRAYGSTRNRGFAMGFPFFPAFR